MVCILIVFLLDSEPGERRVCLGGCQLGIQPYTPIPRPLALDPRPYTEGHVRCAVQFGERRVCLGGCQLGIELYTPTPFG